MPTLTQEQYQRFWRKFKDYVSKHDRSLNLTRKYYPRHYYRIGIEGVKSNTARITLTRNTRKREVTCELIIINWQDILKRIDNARKKLENKLGYFLDIRYLESRDQSKAIVTYPLDPTSENNWEKCFGWLKEKTKDFMSVFPPYLK